MYVGELTQDRAALASGKFRDSPVNQLCLRGSKTKPWIDAWRVNVNGYVSGRVMSAATPSRRSSNEYIPVQVEHKIAY